MPKESETTNAVSDTTTTAPKMVLESDLLAVKHSAKQEKDGLQARITELEAQANTIAETHTKLLQAEAEKSQLLEQLKVVEPNAARADDLATELTATKEAVGNLTTRLLGLKRENMAIAYGVDIKTFENKTEEQLSALEEALKVIGRKPNIDLGGGGASTPPTNAIEQCSRELEALRKK